MKIPPLRLPLFVCFFAATLALAPASRAEDEAPVPAADEGFVPLFNGKNWDGWYFKLRANDDALAQKVYTIEDGMVHVFKDFPAEYELGGKNKTHGLFYTKKTYSRYILRFQYKWGDTTVANNFKKYGYDAGCYFHVKNDKIWPDGIEYQVRYDEKSGGNHTGDVIGAGSKGAEWSSADGKTFSLPSEGGKPLTLPKSVENVRSGATVHAVDGEWNQCEIIVMGDEYAIFKLNGEIVNMVSKLSASEGIIGLQSETAEIYYRDIEIKELPESVPMETFLE